MMMEFSTLAQDTLPKIHWREGRVVMGSRQKAVRHDHENISNELSFHASSSIWSFLPNTAEKPFFSEKRKLYGKPQI